jgi:hypothetical protein
MMTRRFVWLSVAALAFAGCGSGAAVDEKDWGVLVPGGVPSFGVDFAGELYVSGGSSIYKIIEGP